MKKKGTSNSYRTQARDTRRITVSPITRNSEGN